MGREPHPVPLAGCAPTRYHPWVESARVSIPEVLDGDRLDRALKALRPHLSWSHVRRLIQGGRVSVDGVAVTDPRLAVREGVAVEVAGEDEPPRQRVGSRKLAALHEDDWIVAVDKPTGLPSTPAGEKGEPDALTMARRQWGRIYMVHRLDRGTSGAILFARTRSAQLGLLGLFREGKIRKTYLAVVGKAPLPSEGEIVTKLGRPDAGKRQSTERGGRTAITRYRVIGPCAKGTLVECMPLTGRTHQLRIHMAELGCPILGDLVYGNDESRRAADRLLLHAWHLELEPPWMKETLRIESPPPMQFAARAPRGGARAPRDEARRPRPDWQSSQPNAPRHERPPRERPRRATRPRRNDAKPGS